MVRWLILVLSMMSFVVAVDVDFDCPDEVFVDEEFECSLEVYDGNGVYDVKVELDEERDSVIWAWHEDDGVWKSGYYYLIDVVEDRDEVDLKFRVSETGRYYGTLKLRDEGEDREYFDVERIDVEEGLVVDDGDEVDDGIVVLGGDVEAPPQVLSVEGKVVVLGGEVVYESRDWKIVNGLVYGFCVFLIFVVGVLVWERF